MYRYIRVAFVFLLLLISVAAHAGEYIFRMDSVLHELQNAQYGVLRVIDERPGNKQMGVLKVGAMNRSKEIKTTEALAGLLLAYYKKMLYGASQTDKELVLVLQGVIAAATTTQMDNAAEWTAYWAKFDPETKLFVPQRRLN